MTGLFIDAHNGPGGHCYITAPLRFHQAQIQCGVLFDSLHRVYCDLRCWLRCAVTCMPERGDSRKVKNFNQCSQFLWFVVDACMGWTHNTDCAECGIMQLLMHIPDDCFISATAVPDETWAWPWWALT